MSGKATIIKTYIISQFLFVSSAIHMPESYMEKVNKLISNFIWQGKKPKLKWSVLCKPKCLGGLNIPDIAHMLNVNRIKWVKKYLNNKENYWGLFLQHFMLKANIQLDCLLYSNCDVSKLIGLNHIPKFYQLVLKAWVKLSDTTFPKKGFIWYNKNIKIAKTSFFFKDFYDIGIRYLNDLFEQNLCVIPFTIWQNKGLKAINWLKWCGLISAIKHSLSTEQLKANVNKNVQKNVDNNFL